MKKVLTSLALAVVLLFGGVAPQAEAKQPTTGYCVWDYSDGVKYRVRCVNVKMQYRMVSKCWWVFWETMHRGPWVTSGWSASGASGANCVSQVQFK